MSAYIRLKEYFRDIWPLIPAAIYLSFFFFVVLVYLVVMSFSFEGAFPSLESARRIVFEPQFREALRNTLIFVAIGTPLELIIGIFLSLLVYRAEWGKSAIRALFTIPLAIPGLVIATMLFIIFDSQGGFVNHLLQGEYFFFPRVISEDINWRGSPFFSLGLSMMGKVWRDMPISMLIILSALNAIEPELLDAAKTMGAGFRVRVRRIILPLIFPAMTTVLLLRSVEMWKEFIFPYVLAGNHHLLGTLIEALYVSFGGQSQGEAAFVAFVLVVGIIITLFLIITTTQWLKHWFIDPGDSA